MLQQRWSSDRLEVGLIDEDVPPVVHVEDGRECVFAEGAQCILVDDQNRKADCDQQYGNGGEEPAGAAEVKLGETDAPGAVVLLEYQ